MTFEEWLKEEEKKKKKNTVETTTTSKENLTFNEWLSRETGAQPVQYDDIAPVRETEERTWLKGSKAFDDGWDFGDITKTVLGTLGDTASDLVAGATGIVESTIDAGAYLLGGAAKMSAGRNTALGRAVADNAQEFIKKDIINEKAVADTILLGLDRTNYEDYSVFGDKTDSLVQSGGQLLGTVGLQALGVPWFVTTGVTSFGSGTEEAFNEGADYGEAGLSGAIQAGADILTEKLFGGSGLGEKGLINLDGLTKGISNKVVKALTDFGLDMTAEGAEEVAASVMTNLGSALYKEENLGDLLFSEEAVDEYIESFIGGAVLGGGMNGGKLGKSIKFNKETKKLEYVRDYRTGLTAEEEKVFNKVYEDAIAEAEKDGKALSKDQKAELYDSLMDKLDKGYISTDTIEEILGGRTFAEYKSLTETKKAITDEISQLENLPKEQITVKQSERLTELREELKNLRNDTELKKRLSDEVYGIAKNSRLVESYNEIARKGQAFEADLTKYKGKQRAAVERAVKSGVLNNTNRSHELVDILSKIEADKGIIFDYTNNEKLKASGFAIEGKTVNGFEKNGTVTLNVQSAKAWQSTVGHEIGHVLKGTSAYTELRSALYAYAESRGELASRKAALTELYKDMNADIDEELTCDLIGDYLFNDKKFISNLTTNKTVFQKVYDEIKYLWKVATGKEKAEIEKVKREFDKVWENFVAEDSTEVTEDGKVNYSISGKNAKTADNSLLLKAEEMLNKGVDSETVRQETGWYKGYDGKMRFEIDDSEMDFNINGHFTNPDVIRHRELEYKFITEPDNITEVEISELQSLTNALEGVKKRPTTLGDYLKHDKLFAAYPELKGVKISFDKLESGATGKYRIGKNEIVLDNSIRDDNAKIKTTLIHEIQHAIQEIEGFANGSSVEYWEAQRKDIADTIKGARQNLNLWLDDIGYSDFVKSSIKEVADKKKTMEQHWEDVKEFKANSKYAEQIAACEAEIAEYQKRYDEITNGMTAYEQYLNTAGEIEARDTENRLSLTEEERKNTRPDIDNQNAIVIGANNNGGESLTYIGDTKDGRRCYQSGFGEEVSMDDRIKEFKKKIAEIFNLGAVELKTDVKKIQIKGDKFTAQKNLYGDFVNQESEQAAKINSLYDLADILATSKYDPTATNKEASYANPNLKPKNKAHKDVKYWYKFRNEIVFDGVPYSVTFNIRDKGKEQYQYLIEFKENKTSGLSNTAVNNLLRTDQMSYADSIAPLPQNVKTNFSLSESTDTEYMSAIENGDMETAQRLVNEAAEKLGYTTNDDYKISHSAPYSQIEKEHFTDLEKLQELCDEGDDLNLFAVANGISLQPDDYFSPNGARWYMYDDADGMESYRAIKPAMNSIQQQMQQYGEVREMPTIKVYRAVPKSLKESKLQSGGQWVTPSYRYAVKHGNNALNGKYKIIEETVSAENLWWDGNDIREWGFDDGTNYAYRDTKNNRKLLDAVTYDDEGNVIPLSKRFNYRNADERYSISNEGEDIAPIGNYSTPLNETALGPTKADIAKMENAAPTVDAPIMGNKPPKSAQIADGTRGDELLNESLDNYPMETIEQRVAENIRAVEGELADNMDLRREAEANYNEQIEKLREQYAAKKNKNTKVAYNILQSISRIERLKASADAKFAKRISDLEARLEKMNDPKFIRAKYKQAKMQEHAKWAADTLGDTSTWVDKKTGIQYATNTEHRNFRDIVRDENGNVDIARADAIDDALNGRYNREEAEKKREKARIVKKYADLKITNAETAYIQMLGELRHNPDTTLTEKAVQEFYEAHQDKIDTAKVDKVIDFARQDYDSLLEKVNEKLREQGMKEIPYRKGYFLHYTDPKQNFIQKLLNWKVQDNEIPTSIAGLTETFRPVKSWQAFDKTRYSDKTDYNFLKGFDAYLEGSLDWIYHLDTLQKRRAVENHIRFTHSDEGIQARIKEVYANEEYDADEAQAQIEHILAEAKNPLNNFVQDFTTKTNILANKKNSLDRTVEQLSNRKIYSIMSNVQNRTSANMVLANVRSALTNFIPITQSWAQVSPVRSLQAAKETIANAIKDDGTINKSTFLTNRLREVDNLYKTNWDKVLDKAGIMFEIVDNFSSQVIWRSKYNDNLAKGMNESQAIANADQFAENVMAGRSKGNEPTIFNAKNPFVKAFTMFQLEVNNQYGYLFKDVPNDLKAETEHWKFNLAKGYTTAFIGAYVYNTLLEQVAGSGAALDPIGIIEDLLKDLGLFDDDEEEPKDVVMNLVENVGGELPFVGGTLFGGGRIPLSSALPYGDNGLVDGVGNFVTDVTEGNWKNIGKEMMNPVLNVGLPVGGGQLKKTMQGLSMFNTDEDHPVMGSYTDSGALRFPVEDTFGNRIQAGIFGQYANKNAREYFDNGYAPLKEKQIQEYMDVDLPIADYWKYREGLKGLKKNEEKADYINSLNIEDWQKNLLMNNILDRKEDVDMTNYDDYSDWEEFDYAQKNPDKYAFAKSVGGYSAYKTYTDDLYDIKADKDENGKSITGSRKEKVINYINNLDADYETKIILFKSEYPSDDTYNADIINYLNNRDDLTYDERVKIYEALGFTVKDGYVYWD